MKKQLSIENLEVFNLANSIGQNIWDIVINWTYFKRDSIGKQVCRSSDSISANIAEGFGRYSFKENKHFCYYARGSLVETKNWIHKFYDRELIDNNSFNSIKGDLDILHKKLNAYINSIGKYSN